MQREKIYKEKRSLREHQLHVTTKHKSKTSNQTFHKDGFGFLRLKLVQPDIDVLLKKTNNSGLLGDH